MLVQYHILSGEWYRLEIPEHIFIWGKAVDDLVVNDSFLIAIDNIVMPKYLLFYHLNSTSKLEFSHYKELRSNGPWETIRQGRITPDYLGLLSKTQSGWRGYVEHITIYNNLDLTSSFAVSIEVRPQINMGTYIINDFLLVGDNLLIAHRDKGLGIFEIDDSYFEISQDDSFFNPEVDADKINYIQFENEEVIRLTLIPNETKVVLTIRNVSGEIRHEIFQLN
jgi:hypothetical protein